VTECAAVPSRRDQIRMSDEELRGFLDEQRILVVATEGQQGRPHLTALWYVMRDGDPWIFTYARSQKVRNLERVARATLLLESGESYAEMRGAMLYADATIHHDDATVAEVGERLFMRYDGLAPIGADGFDETTRAGLRTSFSKRVAIHFRPTRVVTWDHAKLGGAY